MAAIQRKGARKNKFDAPRAPRRNSYWNPLAAPEIEVQMMHPDLPWLRVDRYPVYCSGGPGTGCDADNQTADNESLVFGRQMPFTRDESRNHHDLTWAWQAATQFPGMTKSMAYSNHHSNDLKTTRLRGVWANYGDLAADPENYYDHLMVITDEAEAIRPITTHCVGETYLGPAFIVARIPGIVDFWPDDRTRAGRPPAGWLLGHDAEAGRTMLYGLGPDALQVETLNEVVAPAGVDLTIGPVAGDVGLLPASTFGQGEGTRLAMAIYQPGSGPPPVTHPEIPVTGARLLLADLEAGFEVTLSDATAASDALAPSVLEARVVLLPRRQQVLLVGQDPSGTAVPVAYHLDFATGTWRGPTLLSGLGDRQGFGLVRDAYGDRLLAFGGLVADASGAGSAASADLFEIDPSSLTVRKLVTDLGDAAARSQAGLFLDGPGRQLYVAGGLRDGAALADALVVDLRSRSGEAVDLSAGPGAVSAPFVHYNRRTGQLWIGDLVGTSTADGLDLWVRSADGTWSAPRTTVGPEGTAFPVQDTYTPGRAHVYWVDSPADAVWPGTVYYAKLEDGDGGLGAAVRSAAGAALAESEPQGSGLAQVGFRCPAGQRCRIEVSPELGVWPGGTVPFTLDVNEASLVEAGHLWLPAPARDLVKWQGRLVVAGPLGVGVLDPATLQWTGAATRFDMTAAQALAPCGGYLCVARLGLHGLKVLDLSDPAHPAIRGGTFTAGLGWDVAATGRSVFMAHGWLGLGRYEVDAQGHPQYLGSLHLGGNVRSVAVQGDLLAVALRGGEIRLYRIDETLQPAAVIQAQGRIDRVRFVAGHIWVLSQRGDLLEVFSAQDPDAPVALGNFAAEAATTFREVWQGTRLYTYSRRYLQVRQVVSSQP